MKDRWIGSSLVSGAIACAVLALAASSVLGTVYERDEINRQFTLPAKARVDVFAISGSVDIKAIDGEKAIVQIERTARTRAELDCNKVVLEQPSGNLLIRSELVGCQNTDVTQRVLLSLPRTVDVGVHNVSGPINVGEIEGRLRIIGNSGNISLVQSGRDSIISGNSGTTTVKLRQLDAGGLALSGNSGPIKLHVADDLNIDVKVSGLSGSVSSELPNVKFDKTGPSDYSARIGSGGPTIHVAGSSGSISLRPYWQ
ncbi:MAG TPA: DUF4097 family beta strand repeat-containing protein [Pyrinomonadaceae bacterium]|nr:DUF4097 family beta strand repeat-containing protein [Pyrinomonadaceae bacterium]